MLDAKRDDRVLGVGEELAVADAADVRIDIDLRGKLGGVEGQPLG